MKGSILWVGFSGLPCRCGNGGLPQPWARGLYRCSGCGGLHEAIDLRWAVGAR